MQITIFKDILTVNTPYFVDISTIIDRIKTGKSKGLIERIRNEPDKKLRTELKKNLPSICFSGTFFKRANQSIIKHSGLVCIDFDHLENVQDFKNQIINDKYTFIAFISPSGDGLKVIIKIPANIETHANSCKSLKQYYKNDKLDNFEDVARVCFESFDSEIFYNENSEIYTELYKEETITKKVETHYINHDYDEIFNNLKKWIEGFDNYQDGNKHKFLVKFAGALNRFGVPEYISVQKLSYNYQYAAGKVAYKDFETIVKNVYSKYSNQFNISYFEKNQIAYERETKSNTPTEFFNEYKNDAIEDKFKTILAKKLIDFDNPPKQQPIILSIRDNFYSTSKRLLTLGNISAIVGKAKSKKTFFHSMITACLISNCNFQNKLIPNLPNNKRQILLFDTEQSEYDVFTVANRIKKMSNSDCNNFGCFSLRGMDANDIIGTINYAVYNLFKEVGVVIIDQIADIVTSLNDEKEANKVLKTLEKLTNENLIHVMCIIHMNKQNEFAQGWLGTNIMKKAETIIKINKDEFNKKISHVESDMMRSIEFEPFSFLINDYGFPEIIETDSNNLQPEIKTDFDF
jgi:hypothetical protein